LARRTVIVGFPPNALLEEEKLMEIAPVVSGFLVRWGCEPA
jgi:hypothetical protein